MNTLKEQDFQDDIFKNNDRIMIHCLDPSYSFELTVPSLPFLSLSVIYCHFNFLNSPSERRLLVVPSSDCLVKKFTNINSPCLVRVLKSVIFEVSFTIMLTHIIKYQFACLLVVSSRRSCRTRPETFPLLGSHSP